MKRIILLLMLIASLTLASCSDTSASDKESTSTSDTQSQAVTKSTTTTEKVVIDISSSDRDSAVESTPDSAIDEADLDMLASFDGYQYSEDYDDYTVTYSYRADTDKMMIIIDVIVELYDSYDLLENSLNISSLTDTLNNTVDNLFNTTDIATQGNYVFKDNLGNIVAKYSYEYLGEMVCENLDGTYQFFMNGISNMSNYSNIIVDDNDLKEKKSMSIYGSFEALQNYSDACFVYGEITGVDGATTTAQGVADENGNFTLLVMDENFIEAHGYKSCVIISIYDLI